MTNLQEVITPMEEKDRFKKLQETEKKIYRAEQQRFELKPIRHCILLNTFRTEAFLRTNFKLCCHGHFSEEI